MLWAAPPPMGPHWAGAFSESSHVKSPLPFFPPPPLILPPLLPSLPLSAPPFLPPQGLPPASDAPWTLLPEKICVAYISSKTRIGDYIFCASFILNVANTISFAARKEWSQVNSGCKNGPAGEGSLPSKLFCPRRPAAAAAAHPLPRSLCQSTSQKIFSLEKIQSLSKRVIWYFHLSQASLHREGTP